MTGNGISGVGGDCIIGSTPVHEIKKWSFKPKSENKDYASNYTGGYKKRVLSVKDATGTLDFVWDPWNPITAVLDVGTAVILKLQTVATQFYLVPAIVDDLSLDVDIETGAVESGTISFSLNGAWTNPVALAATTTAAGSLLGPVPHMGRSNPDDLATAMSPALAAPARHGEVDEETIMKIADAVFRRMSAAQAQTTQAA